MKLSLVFTEGQITVNCDAETEAEKRILGVLSNDGSKRVVASVRALNDGHYTHGKVDYVRMTLSLEQMETE